MLFFFSLDVLDEIWDVIKSVSEGFLTYSFIHMFCGLVRNKAIHFSRLYQVFDFR